MAQWLDKYHGCEVEILYLTDNNVYRDRGRLTDMGDGWVELVKPNAETFLVPTTAIRLMKLVGQAEEPANRLLRPASHPMSDADSASARQEETDGHQP